MPILMVCWASYRHGKVLFVRTPDFGASFEVATSLKRGSRFVRRDDCAYQRGKANVGYPTLALP
jgi:hypothetical protein